MTIVLNLKVAESKRGDSDEGKRKTKKKKIQKKLARKKVKSSFSLLINKIWYGFWSVYVS